MAGGGKETPRQKMVGMMYIVLTALMAMNVSSSILEKFAILSGSLEKSNKEKYSNSSEIMDHIKTSVKEMGNRPADMKVVADSIQLRKATEEVVKFVEDIKTTLIEKTGGINPVTGYPKNLKSDSEVATLMLTQGKAVELQSVLNNYMAFVSKLTSTVYPAIALDADHSPMFKNDPNQKGKNFGDLNFDHTPLGAAIATLNQFMSEVITAEYSAMQKLAKCVGADDVKFDSLKVVVKPNSKYVAAGTKYEAEMFLSASSSAITPDMTVSGRSITVKDGVGIVSFPAVASNYDKDGLSKQSFKASITIKGPGGKDSITEDTVEYYVVKPVVQVQSASVSALYLNCGNELNIQVPALGNDYSPKFTAEGANIVVGNKKGFVTIIPKAKVVNLGVYNNSVLLETIPYSVRTIPKPDLRVTVGGVPINEKDGMAAPGPRIIEVKIVPDESFKSFLPKDARYRVVEWEVTLARGSKAVLSQSIKDKEKANLNDIASVARSGDRIVIEIKKVLRTNFKEEDEVVSLPNSFKTISLIDKK
jgi:gliding motility-associated protein GldM